MRPSPTIPRNRLHSILYAESQGWQPASVEGESGFLLPDGWSLAFRGVVDMDPLSGENVLVPCWRDHGKAGDARGIA